MEITIKKITQRFEPFSIEIAVKSADEVSILLELCDLIDSIMNSENMKQLGREIYCTLKDNNIIK